MPEPLGRYVIYVDGKAMAENVADGGDRPVVVVREVRSKAESRHREVWARGPSVLRQHGFTLEGTKVPAWMECDEVLKAPKRRPWVRGKMVLNVDVPSMRLMAQDGVERPLIFLRRGTDMWTQKGVQKLASAAWSGTSLIAHRPSVALPNTGGRGCCFIQTDALKFRVAGLYAAEERHEDFNGDPR